MASLWHTHRPALLLTLLLCLGSLVTTQPANARPVPADPVPALTSAAHPLRTTDPTGPSGGLRDLRPLGDMIGAAPVVGLGEATHGSHEFFANKHRVFRYLVEEKGFTAFALEANWSAGLRLDDYVLHGRGDARQILREEFQNTYRFFATREYLDLIEWMRAYNTKHTKKVRFVGDDVGYAGTGLFDRVTGYVRRHHPDLLPRFTELYRAQRPAPGTSVNDGMNALAGQPLERRRAMADSARQALGLLTARRPGTDRGAHARSVRDARVIAQVAGFYAHDFTTGKGNAEAMRHRDEAMADNVAWWHAHTGDKVLLSGHNAHLTYVSDDPAAYPRTQGAVLRDRLGARYVNVRLTFDRGAFNAEDEREGSRVVTLGPADPGSNEHTLDKVPYRDFALDLRTAPAEARAWLKVQRPTRNLGTVYPQRDFMTALAEGYDLLIHLHRVRAAELLRG
ncbi:erythromycin esterase family protein [Streptomyces syringium]|uniref:erythromycin esterase family protein n=1 Tax=Streptomyces syringium TaxID=76729 RepID=UPI00345692B7